MELTLEIAKDQLSFLATILSAKKDVGVVDSCLEKVHRIISKDFVDFSREETTYNNDNGALLDLQEVYDKLSAIAMVPMLYSKNVIAVAGNFSSGKSSFINSLMKTVEINLPTDSIATTAVPTFVMSGNETKVTVFNSDGRKCVIPNATFAKMRHALIDSLGFNLKSLMNNLSVTTCFKDEYKDLVTNVCFIDTPGNDASGANSSKDGEIAFDALKDSSAMIWAINISSGTVNKNSLNYISKILEQDPEKKIYVLCTHADKCRSNIQDLLTEINDVFDENGIEIEGISAYTSRLIQNFNTGINSYIGKEIPFDDNPTSVFDFIKKQNSVFVDIQKRCIEIVDVVNRIQTEYRNSIQADLEKMRAQKSKTNDFRQKFEDYQYEMTNKLNMAKSNSGKFWSGVERFDYDLDFSDLIDDRTFNDERNLSKCAQIFDSLKNAINEFFKSIASPDVFKCPKCGCSVPAGAKFCSKCGTKLV